MTRQTSGAVDLEGVERRVATARRVIDSLTKEFPERSEVIRAPCYLAALAVDCLALIARVRELETKVVAQKAIISTGMSAFIYGRSQGREEGIAAERRRCVEMALNERVDAEATGSAEDEAYNAACEDIANAIERGDG